MSNTSKDITDRVEQCGWCYGWFVLGLEGEGHVCDKCRDQYPDKQTADDWVKGELAL